MGIVATALYGFLIMFFNRYRAGLKRHCLFHGTGYSFLEQPDTFKPVEAEMAVDRNSDG